MSDCLVIIPTFNERENITAILQAIMDLPDGFHVLVVDDGSPDGTGQLVRDIKTHYPDRIFLEERAGKQGLGTAYIHGFRWGLQKGYLYMSEMDADFSHPVEVLPELFNTCKNDEADVVVGSRWTTGGGVKDWPLNRRLLSRFASYYVRLITRIPVNDTTAGFVCYKSTVLRKIDLDQINFLGYAFQIQMKYAAWKLGARIKEVPILFIDRQKGKSKMSMDIFNEAFVGVWKMKRKNYSI